MNYYATYSTPRRAFGLFSDLEKTVRGPVISNPVINSPVTKVAGVAAVASVAWFLVALGSPDVASPVLAAISPLACLVLVTLLLGLALLSAKVQLINLLIGYRVT